jgi:hypothetical protein
MEFKKVRRQGEQKVITIPIKSEIEVGDYVRVEKIKDEGNK